MSPSEPVEEHRTAHIGWMLGLLPFALAATALLLVAGGDVPLFLVLLNHLSLPTVLIGLLVTLAPAIASLCVIFAVTDWKFREMLWSALASRRWIAACALLLAIVVAITASWIALVVFLGVTAVVLLGDWLARRFWPPAHRWFFTFLVSRKDDGSRPSTAITAAALGLILLTGPMVPWLPIEQIATRSGDPTYGYVVGSDTQWTTVVTPARAITILKTSDVESRTVCGQGTHISIANLVATALARAHVGGEIPVCESTAETP